MIPIVCLVGASDGGKTTFMEKLIPALSGRGYAVGTVKHDVHGFEMDREGKDTWRHRKAGARVIAISSPVQVATIRNVPEEMDLKELVTRYFWQEDVVLAEGFKRSPFPKIEVFRSAVEPLPICTVHDHLVAMVTDDPVETEVPVFGFRQVEQVAGFIEDRYLKGRKRHAIEVVLDGKRLPVKDFVQDFVRGGIVGMLSTLRGWEKPRDVHVHIRLEDE